jgi:CyaY protein
MSATATPLTDADYRAKAHAMLDVVETQVDAWLDADVVDIDSHRTGGLLELSFPNGSKIIINTQPPLQEIWLAAKAGGYHFKYVDGAWRDTRDGSEFLELLSANASAQAASALKFSA